MCSVLFVNKFCTTEIIIVFFYPLYINYNINVKKIDYTSKTLQISMHSTHRRQDVHVATSEHPSSYMIRIEDCNDNTHKVKMANNDWFWAM